MRSTFRGMFVAGFAALAIGAIGVSAASAALPELHPAPNIKIQPSFEVKWEGEYRHIEFKPLSFVPLWCRNGTAQGKFTSAKAGLLTSTVFTGCVLAVNPAEPYINCSTKGAALGELKAESNISVGLVYLSKATKSVGLLLNETTGNPLTFIKEFECGSGISGPIKGSVALPVSPINTLTQEFKLSNSLPEYENAEGKKVKTTFQMQQANQGFQETSLVGVTEATKLKVTGSEKYEIRA